MANLQNNVSSGSDSEGRSSPAGPGFDVEEILKQQEMRKRAELSALARRSAAHLASSRTVKYQSAIASKGPSGRFPVHPTRPLNPYRWVKAETAALVTPQPEFVQA